MMRILRLTATLSVLVTAVACGTPGQNGSSSNVASVTSSSPIPKPTRVPPAMRPNQVQADSRVVDLRPVRWASTNTAGKDVTIQFSTTGQAQCNTLGRVDVAETAQTVTITVLVGRLPNTDCTGPQPQLAAPTTTVVTLNQPVGDRTIRDGAPNQ